MISFDVLYITLSIVLVIIQFLLIILVLLDIYFIVKVYITFLSFLVNTHVTSRC